MKRLSIFLLVLCGFSLNATNETSQELVTILRDFGSGAAGGAAAMAVYTPFHYFQNRRIQNLPIVQNPRYWFRGLPSLALGKAPTVAVQIGTYGLATRVMQKCSTSKELSSQQTIAAAMLAGGASGVVTNYTHNVALQQENTGSKFSQTNKYLLPNNHARFTRGLGTTICREMLFTNIYLNFLQDIENRIHEKINNKIQAQLASSLLSGVLVAGTTQPFMAITAKLYADPEKKLYKNGIDACIKMAKKEGFKVFYKGTAFRMTGVILALPVLSFVQKSLKG